VTGRHRNPRRSIGAQAIVASVVLVAAIVVGWAGVRLVAKHSPTCAGSVTLTVAAAPEIAPAVQATAADWTAQQTSGTCVHVTVNAGDPGDVAAAIAGQHGATLTGLGQPNGKVGVPDVWIADSSTWVQRVRSVVADLLVADTPSVALSPVVLAMPQPLAASLGWPGTKLTWSALLQKMTSGAGLKAGIVEPARDASGLSGLLALGSAAAAAGGQAAQSATVAGLRALANNRSTLRADLIARFPRSADPAALGSALAAAPLPEQAVLAYDAAQPPVPLAGVFVDPAPAPLDYPYVVLSGVKPEVKTAAAGLLGRLSGAAYRDRLAHLGLRAADGSTGTGFSAGPGAPATPAPAATRVDAAVIGQTLNTWSAVTQPGRVLTVIDVSGSMKLPVPTAGGKTREQVTVEAAAGGLALFGDDWSVGLWTFSTKMNGDIPYRQLVGIGSLATQRSQLATALGQVVPSSGDTGLYDTVLAAYREVQAGWDAGRINSVVLLTDGQNDNPGGLTLDQLITQLKKVVDPAKRIQLIAIGIGEASQAELEKITQVTGGGVFIAQDPSKIGEIFLQAIALRPGSGG
jgi:Ca-activated chloride channel homolog